MTEEEQDLVDLHSMLMMGNKWEYNNSEYIFFPNNIFNPSSPLWDVKINDDGNNRLDKYNLIAEGENCFIEMLGDKYLIKYINGNVRPKEMMITTNKGVDMLLLSNM